MYCPKCSEKFEEGSRRFCPTDGARLLSETNDPSADKWQGGIFSNLIPKPEPQPEKVNAPADAPRFVMFDPQSVPPKPPQPKTEDLGGDFFVLDDAEPEPPLDNIFSKPMPPTD
jgi:hypothetical protein